jgi:hypothetical protein
MMVRYVSYNWLSIKHKWINIRLSSRIIGISVYYVILNGLLLFIFVVVFDGFV